MRTFLLSITLPLALAAATGAPTGAMAQTAPSASAQPSAAADAVGHWLYDAQGNAIGSVQSLTDGDRTAVIMIGTYFRPGSHEERVPAQQLSVVDGKVTLQTESVMALNGRSAQ